jgi:hypothetical protein
MVNLLTESQIARGEKTGPLFSSAQPLKRLLFFLPFYFLPVPDRPTTSVITHSMTYFTIEN